MIEEEIEGQKRKVIKKWKMEETEEVKENK